LTAAYSGGVPEQKALPSDLTEKGGLEKGIILIAVNIDAYP